MNWTNLDQPLLEFSSGNGTVPWTIRDSCAGLSIMGSSGGGKSSGSAKFFIMKMLQAGYGGLLLTVKPTDKDDFVEYCRLTGREADLCIIEPGGKHKMNLFDYEQANSGPSAITENLVATLKSVITAGDGNVPSGNEDSFWRESLEIMLASIIDVCKMAYGFVTIQMIFDVGQSLPKEGQRISPEKDDPLKETAFYKAYSLAKQKIKKQVKDWEEKTERADREALYNSGRYEEALFENVPNARVFKMIDQFFVETLRNLSSKTRTILDFKILNFLWKLLKDPVYSLFFHGKSTVSPDDCKNGKLIILALPTKIYNEAGRFSQIMAKLVWQRAMEKREITENVRPVMLVSDEAQSFIVDSDQAFQLTARSAFIAVIYITQGLMNYYVSFGGTHPEYKVKSFLSNLATKVLHCSTCIESNRWFSDLIGEDFFEDENQSTAFSGDFSHSRGKSYKLRKIIREEEFQKLKTGGLGHNFLVEGYIHKQGSPLSGTDNHIKVVFNQHYKP